MGVASLRPKLMDWKSWWKCGTPRTEVDSEAEVDPLGSSWGHRQRQSEPVMETSRQRVYLSLLIADRHDNHQTRSIVESLPRLTKDVEVEGASSRSRPRMAERGRLGEFLRLIHLPHSEPVRHRRRRRFPCP